MFPLTWAPSVHSQPDAFQMLLTTVIEGTPVLHVQSHKHQSHSSTEPCPCPCSLVHDHSHFPVHRSRISTVSAEKSNRDAHTLLCCRLLSAHQSVRPWPSHPYSPPHFSFSSPLLFFPDVFNHVLLPPSPLPLPVSQNILPSIILSFLLLLTLLWILFPV